jgi:hypothetical protein
MQSGRRWTWCRGRIRAAAGWRGAVLSATALCAVSLLPTCELATKPPKLQSRLIFPSASTSVAVTDLLPANVQVVGSNFRLTLAPATLVTRSLEEMCGAPCASLPWLSVPKPGFTDSIDVAVRLESDIVGATVTGGAIELALTHGLGFDLLHPIGATRTGSLRVSARSGSTVLGTLLIDEPFPHGETLHRTVALQPGDVSSDFILSIMLDSPVGSAIPLDSLVHNATAFGATMTLLHLDASEVRVRLHDKDFSTEQMAVDLSGIDHSVIRRLRGGAARITIDNPFAVTGTFELRLQHEGVEVRRTAQIVPGRNTSRIELSEAELQALLGHTVLLTLSGTVTAPDGYVAVRPTQHIGITTTVELVIEIG